MGTRTRVRFCRVEVNGAVYYLLTGPRTSSGASGPAAYTFDEKGNFVGWTSDMGDIFMPPVVFTLSAQRQPIDVDVVRDVVRGGKSARTNDIPSP